MATDELTGLAAVPALQRRRLSPLCKLALNSAVLARQQQQSVDYIIWSSLYGDEEKTTQILLDVARRQTPSPTQFSTSVHNAIAGLYSILFQDATPSTSLSAGWSAALLEATACLQCSAAGSRVLLVAYEQPLPLLYGERSAFEPFALATVVSLAPQGATVNMDRTGIRACEISACEPLNFYRAWQADPLLEWPQ